MKKYVVELVKRVRYEVEAKDAIEAKEIATELDKDKNSDVIWLNAPYEEVVARKE